MLSIMPENQIFSNLHNSYHPTFKRIKETYIQPRENIFFVGDASHTIEYQEDYGSHKLRRSSFSCFIVITSYRWFRAGMKHWSGTAGSVIYRQIGSRFGSFFGEDFYQHKWVFPPTPLPTREVIGKKSFSERVGEYIREVQLSDIESFHGKNNYSIIYQGEQIELLEIVFEDTWVAFKALDGERVYSLLQIASQNQGHIPLQDSEPNMADDSSQDSVQVLKRIKEMLDAGLITQADYDAKKQEMLSKM